MSSALQRQPKIIKIYQHFFDSKLPSEADTNQDSFFTDLFCLNWHYNHRIWFANQFDQLDSSRIQKDLQPMITLFFTKALEFYKNSDFDNPRKLNALETMILLSRTVILKLKTSSNITLVLTGSVHNDKTLSDLVAAIDNTLKYPERDSIIIHRTLHLTLLFACGVNQGAIGAFFQRRDLFNSLIQIISSPTTTAFTYEATLLIGVLANYHKAQAQNLNRYLRRVRDFVETDVMKKIILITSTAMEKCISEYHNRYPTRSFSNTIMSIFPFSNSDDDSNLSTEVYSDLPLNVTAILLPFFEFINANSIFSGLLCEELLYRQSQNEPNAPLTLISALSYVFTHSSVASRAQAYASLGLYTLSALVEADECAEILLKPISSNKSAQSSIPQSPKSPKVQSNGTNTPSTPNSSTSVIDSKRIDICRQRRPQLPLPKPHRPLMESILDCCIIYLRFNIPTTTNKDSFNIENTLIAVHIINRVLWHIQRLQVKLSYHWYEVWSTLVHTLEILIKNWDSISDSPFKETLLNDVAFILVSSIRLGHTYINASSYHYLLLPVVRMTALTSANLAKLPKSQPLIALKSTHINLKNNLTPAAHRSDPLAIRAFLSQSTNEVLNRLERDVSCEGIGEEPLKTIQKFDSNIADSLKFALEVVCNDSMSIVPI
ncbi:hypothetical protein E3Q24_00153 [Wallemia mellicola]|uniref:Armadillo-like helical domain-containing protein n=1 Tax=Wallemia mellicola TaxID=1708541 RepID=A0AB74KKV0_9BASI|nr:hypothetical protein E3Q24_00153 [Wallemia mellicola]TIC38534.1 hypothetical protein E3Q09_00133 [Wallemia mellicola]TIC58085.1 hypothetical protein E3Q04_00112 [Wallemia mellicola]TIC71976.1 hypothetical protein E3Q03_00103 [Wallemia mellicola]